jgi:hypothetical protein
MQTPSLNDLQPASTAARLALLGALAATGLAHGAEPAGGLARCRAMADAAARLACYDALPLAPVAAAAPVSAAQAAVAAAAPVAAATAGPAAPAVTTAAAASFGVERRPAQDEQQVTSRYAGAFEGWSANSRIRLANGQVWQVTDGSTAALYLRDPLITVKRGFLGGFVLEVEGSNQTARVKRVE